MSTVQILVMSDSHGDLANMVRAVELTHPQAAIHLGDGWNDARALRRRFPDLPLEQVPGNCDFCFRGTAQRLLTLEGKRILICHGHTLGVKSGLETLVRAAQEQGADAALFGHTHKPLVDLRNGILLLNPGSIGYGARPTYALLTLGEGQCLGATHVLA